MDSWRDDYIRALAELDPHKQRQLVDKAMAAIEERRRTASELPSEESAAIDRAERALNILKRSLSENRRGN